MDRFPELYTKRLSLRKLDIDDIPSLLKYANNKRISDHILNIPYPYQEPQAVFRISYVVQGFKQKSRYVFAIIHREEEELIGEISLHLDQAQNISELGYWVGEPFWNQGIATEAIGRILSFGFDKLNLDLIFATTNINNPASGKVLLKHGMQLKQQNGNILQYQLASSTYQERTQSPSS